MDRMVLGVFQERNEAESALRTLEDAEFNPKDISIVMKDQGEARDIASSTGTNVAGGAVSGATTGGILGGITGLLIGIGAIAIPGVGALLIGGPLAAALGLTGAAATTVSGAVTGVLAGGLVGALMGLGVPEEDAKYYEERIKAGGILLAVPAQDMDEEDEVKEILESYGAGQVRTVTMKRQGRIEEIEQSPAYYSDIREKRKIEED
jgi:uncharacterized membrane protein